MIEVVVGTFALGMAVWLVYSAVLLWLMGRAQEDEWCARYATPEQIAAVRARRSGMHMTEITCGRGHTVIKWQKPHRSHRPQRGLPLWARLALIPILLGIMLFWGWALWQQGLPSLPVPR
jgi:polyferredoxin